MGNKEQERKKRMKEEKNTKIVKEEVKGYKEIELRSEEVQEVMSHVPAWILRQGITVLCCIVVVLLIGSYLFKYPDIVVAEITVSTQNPPIYIVAKTAGRLGELSISNGSEIEKETILGVIENAAKTKDVLCVKERMRQWEAKDYPLSEGKWLFDGQYLQLGEVQATYALFISALNDYAEFIGQDYYNKKLVNSQKNLCNRKEYYRLAERQYQLAGQEQVLAKRIYSRDSILYIRKVIVDNEYDEAQCNYLKHRQTHEGMQMSLSQIEMQIEQDRGNLLDLHHQALTEEQKYTQNLKNATGQLQASITSWEQRYLLVAPISGKLTFMSVWSDDQYLTFGESLFVIAPKVDSPPIGRALLPIQASGKVKTGQQVNVRLNNYPDQEFGYVKGKVINVSPVPTEEAKYVVDIEFPKGLCTNYDKKLPMSRELKGTAEIITEDMRLIERLFAPIKKLKEHIK